MFVGGGGALVKGNPLRTSDPNQRPFFAVKLNKKQDKGETMQVKKEMKHAIGLFIESWNPLPMHPPPLLPAPYVLQIPLSSELQTNPNTLLPFTFALLTGLYRYQHFFYLRLARVLRLHGM